VAESLRKGKEPRACLCLVLHAHLPYVRHPEYKEYLEEDWFFEAMTETYLRLADLCSRLEEDRVPFRMSLSITPTLLEMLRDPLLLDRFERRLGKLSRLSELEEERTRGKSALHKAAWFYVDFFRRIQALYHDLAGRDLVGYFALQAEGGNLEILGSAATHAVLPLLGTDAGRRAQIRSGRRIYRRHLGKAPAGFWLPECGYSQGLDRILAGEGITHFFLESTSLLLGEPGPIHGTWAPVATPGGPVAFARDPRVARRVWGAREGYPGHPVYREFYRDLAFDGEKEYLEEFLHSDGVRRPLGIKYHRVTGLVPLYEKETWDPEAARRQARIHAKEFVEQVLREAAGRERPGGAPPLVTATFDAELFGHWWFEGPWFVEELFREMAHRNWELEPVTPGEWLERYDPPQVVQPEAGTWGAGSNFSTWLNPDNAWIWRHLRLAEKDMARVVAENRKSHGPIRRALDQALRELLLAQSSDWPFIMTRRTMVAYAVRRFRVHIHSFRTLLKCVEGGVVDGARLSELEERHPFGQGVDYRDFA